MPAPDGSGSPSHLLRDLSSAEEHGLRSAMCYVTRFQKKAACRLGFRG